MADWTMVQALNRGLRAALDEDAKVVLLGEDIGKLGGVFRVTEGLQKDFGDDRVFDTPLAESAIVGTAVGLAMYGYRPVVEIQFDGFVFPAFDQITAQVARMRFRSGGAVSVPMTIRLPYGGGIGSVEHHGESPEAYFTATPGLRVWTFSTPADAFRIIQQAVRCEDPVLLLEPKRRYWQRGPVNPDDTSAVAPASVVRAGDDCTLICYGPTVATCLEAAERAAEADVSLEVVELCHLNPLDIEVMTASVERTGRAIVVHEAPGAGGLGGEIAQRLGEACFYSLQSPVLRVTGFDTPYPPNRIEADYLPDADRVLDAVESSLRY